MFITIGLTIVNVGRLIRFAADRQTDTRRVYKGAWLHVGVLANNKRGEGSLSVTSASAKHLLN